MLCERCQKNQATVHYTEIINGQKQEMNLCEACARELQPQGFGFMPQLNFHNFLGSFLGQALGAGGFAQTTPGGARCQVCGLTEGEFAQKGLLGCGSCYDSFGNTLEAVVRRIHGTTTHRGKVPERTSDRVKLVKKVESLRLQLQQAVQAEEFEKAAQLRDAIKGLEKRLEQEG